MKRFLFLIPPYFDAADYVAGGNSYLPSFTIPYGVLSLIAYLEKELRSQVEFDMLDLNITLRDVVDTKGEWKPSFEKVVGDKLKTKKYDYVGLSALFNSSFGYIAEISQFVKEIDSAVTVIAGGGLPSAGYFHLLNHCPGVDVVCKGEGELPLLRALSSEDFLVACDKDPSFVTRKSLSNGHVPQASYIYDLDLIPSLPYSRINLDDYNSRGIDKRYVNTQGKREMAIHTSRGCPFKCVFCSNPSLHGYDVRVMSLAKVEEEVVRMKVDFGMSVLLVEDDHFFHDKARAKEILKILAKHEIRAEFPNGMAVYAIDDEVADLLAKAGVSAAALAVESGSDFVLSKLMKKPLKTKLVVPAVEALRKKDIRAHAFIIGGIPGETDEHREETRQMLLTTNFDWVHIYAAIPIFGSRLFDICMENNWINLEEDPSSFVATKSIIKAPTVNPEKLQSWIYKTQIEINFINNANVREGAYDRAFPYFDNVVQKYPNHAFGRLLRGICYEALAMPDSANADFAAAEELFGDNDWRAMARDIGESAFTMLQRAGIKAQV